MAYRTSSLTSTTPIREGSEMMITAEVIAIIRLADLGTFAAVAEEAGLTPIRCVANGDALGKSASG
jgi:hypothetical protein